MKMSCPMPIPSKSNSAACKVVCGWTTSKTCSVMRLEVFRRLCFPFCGGLVHFTGIPRSMDLQIPPDASFGTSANILTAAMSMIRLGMSLLWFGAIAHAGKSHDFGAFLASSWLKDLEQRRAIAEIVLIEGGKHPPSSITVAVLRSNAWNLRAFALHPVITPLRNDPEWKKK